MTFLNLLRIALCIASVSLAAYNSPFWWVAVAPWAVLCLIGIIMTIPLLFIIGMGAGAAQADWMSDEFIFTLIFIIPTILSVLFHSVIKPWLNRLATKREPGSEDSAPVSQETIH